MGIHVSARQAGRQAGRRAGRQAGRQAGRRAGGDQRATHEMTRLRSLAAVKWPTALCCTEVGLWADTT